MKEVIKTCLKIAKTKASVLIRGESGTGKELIAKAIHYNSDRAQAPFITINCAAIPETLLEAELFGYEKGAFTGAYTSKPGKFELADGGTLFLDEIGDLPLPLQAKLLRVLQEQTFERLGSTKVIKVDVRIIAATNRELEQMIKKGEFREDLYWRLNVVPIYLPTLKERIEDIPILVDHFLNKFNSHYGKNVKISSDVLNIFLKYSWPGNVRELENLIERLVLLCENEVIKKEDLPFYIIEEAENVKKKPSPRGLPREISELEKEKILEALRLCEFNQSRAARLLGLTRTQLCYRIKKYDLKKYFPSAR